MLYLVSVFPAVWYKIYSVTTNPVSQVQSGPQISTNISHILGQRASNSLSVSNCPLNFLFDSLKVISNHSVQNHIPCSPNKPVLSTGFLLWWTESIQLSKSEIFNTALSLTPCSLADLSLNPTSFASLVSLKSFHFSPSLLPPPAVIFNHLITVHFLSSLSVCFCLVSVYGFIL